MIGIGWIELLLLACVALPMFLGLIVVLLAAIRYLAKSDKPPTPALAVPFAVQSQSHQDVLRSRYFVQPLRGATRNCPRCRAPLAGDAPEGLCPACLLAGGLEGNSLPPTSSGHGTPSGGGGVDAAALAEAFPNLEIVELLGQGGMGTVFKVRQKNLDRLAALKVIPPQAALDPTFAERFSREARALARLNHSSIVTVYDFGQSGGFYFLLMEYVDGPNLRQLMRTERIAPREALAIVPQICDALQYAHDQGIVHRDIKPENVLLDRTGRVKIADFGLAKLLGTNPADFTLTHTQQVMGTPRYMAPEQIEHPQEVDHRADIYSLGVVLYEMLTGELPIGRFAPPSQKVQVDVRLDEIVLRSLEKEPARRYQRVSEIRTEIESVGSGAGVSPPAANPPPPNTQAYVQASAIEQATSLGREKSSPPLVLLLVIALGMVLGMLMVGAGLSLMALPWVLPNLPNGSLWAFLGAGIGVLIGGAGSLLGCYNSYRQLAGAVDLMSSPEITWFDYVLLGYTTLGVLIMIPGIQGMLTNPREEHVLPMLIIGDIFAVQGAMGLIWRWGARNLGWSKEQLTRVGPGAGTVRPGIVLAVVVPTLVMAAVWGLVLADFHLMTRHWPQTYDHILFDSPGGGRKVSAVAVDQRTAAIRGLWFAAGASVAIVFCGLWLWRMVGPRQTGPGESAGLSVAPPFGHPAWPTAVVVISFATMVFPWVRLHLDDVIREPDFKAFYGTGLYYPGDTFRSMTGMPQGERFIAMGYEHMGGAAAALLAGLGTLLAAGMMSSSPASRRVTAGIATAGGVVAVMILCAFAHRLGERDESLLIDAVTQRQVAQIFSGNDVGPASVPVLFVKEYLNLSPALGLYLAAGMAGLLLLIGTTQYVWLQGIPEGTRIVPKNPLLEPSPIKAALPDRREVALAQVRGPGAGLIVSGILGLVPVVLLCVAIPSWTVLTPVNRPGSMEPKSTPPEFRFAPVSGFANLPLPLASTTVLSPPALLAADQSAPIVETTVPVFVGILGIVIGASVILSLPASILLILGGMKMRQLRSYGLVMMAAIAALLPLGPQWLVSLPMGIWALSVLSRAEVKSAFE